MFDESGEPIAQPLKTWDGVLNWKPSDAELFTAAVKLSSTHVLPERHRTLVCHDMAGGYLHDRFTQGCDDAEAYRFYHWQYVDIFVYFSHYFVTIPPPGWTNAAHIHGKHILGTVITEWDDGKEVCKKFLESKETCTMFAEKLAHMAAEYGFDGWLINIENPIEKDKVELLEEFVSILTEKMHRQKANSCVLWYDSVIKTGELKWQNRLNDLNCKFFEACDGMFLNYTWKDADLDSSKELALSKYRAHDVYVGVDVFGRGCRGGGGYNTNQAVQAARERDMSVAIFAQGWVYETKDKTKFTTNENRFWSLLHDVCPLREIVQLSEQDGLVTTFCQGHGNKLFLQGQVISDKPWSNLSLQSLQPSYTNAQFKENNSEQEIISYLDDGYLGGSCLGLNGNFTQSAQPSLLYRLFKTDIEVDQDLEVCWAHKFLTGEHDVALKLTCTGRGGGTLETLDYFIGTSQICKYVFGRQRYDSNERACYYQGVKEMDANGWHISKARCSLVCVGYKLKEVAVEIFRKDKSKDVTSNVLLGMIQVTVKPPNAEEVILVTNMQCKNIPTAIHNDNDNEKVGANQHSETEADKDQSKVVQSQENTVQRQRLSAKVTWTYPEVDTKHFHIYSEHVDKDGNSKRNLIGQTRSCQYVVPYAVLDNMDPPVHVEVVPVRYDPWKKELPTFKTLLKDVKIA